MAKISVIILGIPQHLRLKETDTTATLRDVTHADTQSAPYTHHFQLLRGVKSNERTIPRINVWTICSNCWHFNHSAVVYVRVDGIVMEMSSFRTDWQLIRTPCLDDGNGAFNKSGKTVTLRINAFSVASFVRAGRVIFQLSLAQRYTTRKGLIEIRSWQGH